MNRILTTLGALALTTTAGFSGGLDRSGQSVGALFEKGDYVELSFGRVSPSISGVQLVPAGPGSVVGAQSGNMAQAYTQFGMAVKTQLTDSLALGVILDQPFGANVSYPTGTGYFAQGSTATLSTTAVTAILKYTTANNISVYGGLRHETMDAVAAVPFVANYKVRSDQAADVGYLVGVAYEKPEIALRVALTYNSKISHDFNTMESSLLTANENVPGTTTVNSPQSVNLEFQSGVAKDTLVFGSVRWADWSNFVIDPTNYPAPTPLVSYDTDTVTYSLGVGRRFSEKLSGSISFGYEKKAGGFAANLGPTDGRASITIGAAYTTAKKVKISGGVSYVQIGDAQTTLNGVTAASNFNGNTAIGVGMKISYSF